MKKKTRQEVIDEVVTEISKEKNIPEHEVKACDVTMRLAEKIVSLTYSGGFKKAKHE